MHRPGVSVVVAAVIAVAVAGAAGSARGENESKKESASAAVSKADRRALEASLDKVWKVLPTPEAAFRPDREGEEREIATEAPAKNAKGGWVAPATARGTKVYAKPAGEDSGGEDLGLEISVYLNLEASLPDPLGSVGGGLRVDRKDGAPVVRHMVAGLDASRVALPLTEEERKNALTVTRIYVGAPAADDYLGEIAEGRAPSDNPWSGTPVRKASDLRTIVVEYHGPAEEVDRLTEATPVAKLRTILVR